MTPCRIGVTGGIGAGKSFVMDVLEKEFGIPVFNCDARAKEIITTNEDVRSKLRALVGCLDKQSLATYLFQSEEHARRVNGIVHPAVRLDFRQWTQRQETPIVAMESAILVQAGFLSEVDKLICVTAPMETRIERTMRRDGANREQVMRRIDRQDDTLPPETMMVNNPKGTTKEDIIKQIKQILRLC